MFKSTCELVQLSGTKKFVYNYELYIRLNTNLNWPNLTWPSSLKCPSPAGGTHKTPNHAGYLLCWNNNLIKFTLPLNFTSSSTRAKYNFLKTWWFNYMSTFAKTKGIYRPFYIEPSQFSSTTSSRSWRGMNVRFFQIINNGTIFEQDVNSN